MATVSANKTDYVPGETISASWSITPTKVKDWVGLVGAGQLWTSGANFGENVSWFWTGGASSGSKPLVAPTSPGSYDLLLYTSDTGALGQSTLAARSSSLTVSSSTAVPTPQPSGIKPMPWVAFTEYYYSPIQARIWADNPINLLTGIGANNRGPQQRSVWHEVDLAPYGVAVDAKFADLSGLLVITSPNSGETPDIHISYARADDTNASPPGPFPPGDAFYVHQTTVSGYGGSRAPASVRVPLSNGKFKWSYWTSTNGEYPNSASYAVNLTLTGWGR